MKRQTKLTSTGQHQLHAAEQQTQEKSALEFATAEELLRYDADHTTVPAGIAQRLQENAATLPRPARSWWRRLFKK